MDTSNPTEGHGNLAYDEGKREEYVHVDLGGRDTAVAYRAKPPAGGIYDDTAQGNVSYDDTERDRNVSQTSQVQYSTLNKQRDTIYPQPRPQRRALPEIPATTAVPEEEEADDATGHDYEEPKLVTFGTPSPDPASGYRSLSPHSDSESEPHDSVRRRGTSGSGSRGQRLSRRISRGLSQAWAERQKSVCGFCTRCHLCFGVLVGLLMVIGMMAALFFTVKFSYRACESNPCQFGGSCAEFAEEATCTCADGYRGVWCEIDEDNCDPSPCVNNSTCHDLVDDFVCECEHGYGGKTCDQKWDDCKDTPCQNGASCADKDDDYFCACVQGYEGNNCEIGINECDSGPCQNGATCNDLLNQYSCTCAPGYTGFNCPTDINDCESSPCVNGGTCVDRVNRYTCNCVLGYSGTHCGTDINECASKPCRNGGTCTDHVNYYTCGCVPGYTGDNCETDIDECVSQPCRYGGTCVDEVNALRCQCVAGYVGRLCETDYYECHSSPCKYGGTCVDLINKYTCTCVRGYSGTHCQTNIQDCKPDSCKNRGTCKDLVADFQCSCAPGYTGKQCETNINECASAPCENGGTCVDTINAYQCTCVNGYSGNNCQKNIYECQSGPCRNGGTCVDGVNQYTCNCVAGWIGTNCQTNEPDCTSTTCLNGGTCHDLINTFRCDCKSGFSGNICQMDIDECVSNICQNGECDDLINAYRCDCSAGYSGTYCQTNINECASNPCTNGGSCVDGINKYTCVCVAGYVGTRCQTNKPDCYTGLCKNGATCVDLVNGYRCNCAGDFTGSQCQTPINQCQSNPCQYGSCQDLVNAYKCTCISGYTGTRCNLDINECASAPCKNGGTCNNKVNYYTCACKTGYHGTTCQSNYCSPDPCKNGGTCTLITNSYRCSCPPDFTGTTCTAGHKKSFCVALGGSSFTYKTSTSLGKLTLGRNIYTYGYSNAGSGVSISSNEYYLFSMSGGLAKSADVTLVMTGNYGLRHPSKVHTMSDFVSRNVIVNAKGSYSMSYKGTIFDQDKYQLTSWCGVGLQGTMNPVVAFSAYRTTTATSGSTVSYTTNLLNSGNMFKSYNTFSVPRYGIYYFTFSTNVVARTGIQLDLRVNNARQLSLKRSSTAHTSTDTISRTALLRLKPRDSVTVYLASSSMPAATSYKENAFSGFYYSPEVTAQAWSAYRSNSWSAASVKTSQTLRFDREWLDEGGLHNTATGEVTIKVTGVYYVSFSVGVYSSKPLYVQLRVNDVNKGAILRAQGWQNNLDMLERSMVLRLTAGQKVTVWTDACVSCGCYVWSDTAYKATAFMGFLLFT